MVGQSLPRVRRADCQQRGRRGPSESGEEIASSPPNVLLFISDQQRADTMPGVRRTPGIKTPHLDWLEQQSASFRRAYCVTPLCTPARTSLLSGLYPHTHGLTANHKEETTPDAMRLSSSVTLLAGYLRAQGYVCGYTGKW